MAVTPSGPGFVFINSSLRLVACNSEAARILTFPSRPEQIKQLQTFLGDRVRSTLIDRSLGERLNFIREYRSGKRRYVCRAFEVDRNDLGQVGYAIVLDRHASKVAALRQVSEQFGLTERELETVQLLLQGLTSKEMATRMNISPNTVKAFLRMVMVKMGVSTRSAVAGKLSELD